MTFTIAAPLEKRGMSGKASYYGPPNDAGPFGIGACGNNPVDHNYFVSVGASVFDRSQCNQCVQVNYNGRSSIGPVADRCVGCGSGVDISLTMMNELTDGQASNLGVVNVDWDFVPCPSHRAAFVAASPHNVVGSA
ncbi:RlpA-like double-psi beta-barrel-protein domain-containing protein-containing protein [Globomyces pollinis-pini]|nr:RlpA-like double-psi beta-barrel-protein domain-containing protein-containing protein [Globomyces pollinis-pini]